MDYLLGIDVGTTNLKAALFTEDGTLHSLSNKEIKTFYNKNDEAYYEPNRLWEEISLIVKECIQHSQGAHKIAAVSVASMGEAGVVLDKNGEPLLPSIAWFERSSIKQSTEIEKRIGAEKIFEITGLEISPIFSLPKILWIREKYPDIFKKISKWLCMADYVYFKLTGAHATDYTIASHTMVLDLLKKDWSELLLDAFDLNKNLFPPILVSGTRLGSVTSQASKETAILEGTPVVIGGHDQLCGFLSSGSLIRDKVLLSSGTVESIVALLKPDVVPPKYFKGLRIGFFLDPSRLCTKSGVTASGVSIDWFLKRIATGEILHDKRDNQSKINYAQILNQVKATMPGSRGLFFLPHMRGAGGPYWDPHSRGAFIGLRDTHTPEEMLRAIMESISFETKIILDTMVDVFDIEYETLNSIGGGTKNIIWQQIKANIIEKTIELPDVVDSAAKGAALLAGIGVGIYSDMISASKETFTLKECYYPEQDKLNQYKSLFSIYKLIYPAIKNINQVIDNSYLETTCK